MPGKDPDHWLHRLDAVEWLAAARNELGRAETALAGKQYRPGLAGARRAAGMAWNAILVIGAGAEAEYGRSYMDHLKALAVEQAVPPAVREAAGKLLAAPVASPLVTLGAHGDISLASAARIILEHAEQRVAPGVSA